MWALSWGNKEVFVVKADLCGRRHVVLSWRIIHTLGNDISPSFDSRARPDIDRKSAYGLMIKDEELLAVLIRGFYGDRVKAPLSRALSETIIVSHERSTWCLNDALSVRWKQPLLISALNGEQRAMYWVVRLTGTHGRAAVA